MYTITKKYINNVSTASCEKNIKINFMHISNQINLTKKVYLLYKANNGLIGYLHFKKIVPARMLAWISKNKDITETIPNAIDMLSYINKLFLRQNHDIYSSTDIAAENNIFRSNFNVSTSFPGRPGVAMIVEKNGASLTADDIKNLDVWEECSTEINNDAMRYRNSVPIWQKSMNTRHYDRGNQGYRSSPEHSSITTFVSGYGDAMTELRKMVDSSALKNVLNK